jgi:hypothetical protein
MFITPAFAQSATDTATGFGGSGFEMIILFVPLMVVWYFLLIRPQRAQAKKREETLKAIRRGDQVVTVAVSSVKSPRLLTTRKSKSRLPMVFVCASSAAVFRMCASRVNPSRPTQRNKR